MAEAAAIDADVYGLPLVLTAITGVLLLLAGSVALGVAVTRVARADAVLRAAGVVYAVAMACFLVVGTAVHVVQPVAAAVAALAAVVVALRLPRL
ncbi:hypothetical protein [Actinomycetospora straminea]|uniref:hypothetical protein n=1 Tax=Actinomycetospora straminea TaxID=663607 RepID=UPI002365F7AB|nr:hypothetical protein [Actinomycetospora straminea]MDD7932874.1 hypothetical protein [Actinomycetospora straminea]